MRFATLLELYSQLDTIFGGVTLLLFFLLTCLLAVDLMPEWKIKPIARTGVTVLALVAHVSLLIVLGIGNSL